MAVACLVALAGCVSAVIQATSRSGFDHAAHARRDLACLDCHDSAQTAEVASMPTIDTCRQCHDGKRDTPASTRGVAAFGAALGEKRYPSLFVRGPTYGDVRFSHATHAKVQGVECATCHTGATKETTPNPSGPLSMDACIACHKERGAKTACDTCHAKDRKEERPRNHDAEWRIRHGFVSRAPDRTAMQEKCDLCHARADCDRCHQADPPRDHTQTFRVSTHGLQAGMDRSRCLACHKADSCDRCHETAPPRSHRTGWGAPNDRHCFTCHEPLGVEACTACHQGTPSHRTAPPKPLGHSPAANCRQCHGNGAPLPHVDNGTDCNACHH